jgi:hypothetical protein
VQTVAGVRKLMAQMKQRFPQDIDYTVSLDQTLPVTEGMKEILWTLVIAIVLVIFVVYLFLQDWRATLIPMLAVLPLDTSRSLSAVPGRNWMRMQVERRCAFLAPDIVDSILDGNYPHDLTVKKLCWRQLPIDWTQQRIQLGFSARPLLPMR